jgi:hypothetical protein
MTHLSVTSTTLVLLVKLFKLGTNAGEACV